MEPDRKDPAYLHEPRTVLEPGASVTGKLIYDGPVKIDGKFKGEIKESSLLVLGPGGSGTGKLSYAGPGKIDGKFKGEIKASSLLVVGPQAEVSATISAGQLRIEGVLQGTVRVNEWIEIGRA